MPTHWWLTCPFFVVASHHLLIEGPPSPMAARWATTFTGAASRCSAVLLPSRAFIRLLDTCLLAGAERPFASLRVKVRVRERNWSYESYVIHGPNRGWTVQKDVTGSQADFMWLGEQPSAINSYQAKVRHHLQSCLQHGRVEHRLVECPWEPLWEFCGWLGLSWKGASKASKPTEWVDMGCQPQADWVYLKMEKHTTKFVVYQLIIIFQNTFAIISLSFLQFLDTPKRFPSHLQRPTALPTGITTTEAGCILLPGINRCLALPTLVARARKKHGTGNITWYNDIYIYVYICQYVIII